MKRLLLLLPLSLLPAAASRPSDVPQDLREAVDAAVRKVYPALVNISVVMEDAAGGHLVRQRGTGSGTILDAEGHVLTNHHVAGKATRVVCTLSSKEEIPAEVVGTDAMTDLTVLRLKLSERKDPSKPLPVAALGDSDAVSVGDYVLAMGSPVGLARSVTLGIVSNKERFFGLGMDLEGEPTGELTQWIQHDALILPGNSGGPLVNMRGEIVGINELGGNGVGFAIPASLARAVFTEILRNGRVRRGWLGLFVQPLLKGQEERGALVSSVEPASPAEVAGVRAGDLLLSLDGDPVTIRFEDEVPLLYRRVAEIPVGRTVEVTLLREGKPLRLKAVTGEDGPTRGQEHELKLLAVTARNLTRAMVRWLHLPSNEGVFLSGVQTGGIAGMGKPALRPGDILHEIEGKPLRSVQDLLDWSAAAKPEEKRSVVAVVQRGQARLLSVLKVEVKEDPSRGAQVAKGWFGCETQVMLKPLVEALKLGDLKGVRVTLVHPGTPAEQAGLRAGDIVTQVGGKPVNATTEGHAELFREMERRCRIGEKTALKVLRDGAEADLEVVPAASPVEPKDALKVADRDFEFTAREITFYDRVGRRWDPDQKGCILEGIEPSGWAGFAGLEDGDLVLEVDGRKVGDLDALREVLAGVKEAKPARVVFLVRRGLRTGFFGVEPRWQE